MTKGRLGRTIMIKKMYALYHIQNYSILLLCMMLLGVAFSLVFPFLALFCTDVRGMSKSMFGLFMAILSLSGILINSVIAKRSDNGLDRKNLIILSTISSACGYASYLLFDNNYVLLIVVSLFTGIGAIAMPQMFAFSRECVMKSTFSDHAFANSVLRSTFSLGFIIGPLIGTLVLQWQGYTGLFLSSSIMFIVLAILVQFFLTRIVAKVSDKVVPEIKAVSINWKLIAIPFIALSSLFIAHNIYTIDLPFFIVESLNGTSKNLGMIVSLSAGLEIPIMIGIGAIATKTSNRTILLYSCLFAISYYIVMYLSTDIWQLVVAQLLQACFVAVIMSNGISFFQDLMPNSPGIASTLYSNCFTIGSLVGNLFGGLATQYMGYRNVFILCLVLVLIALPMFLSKGTKREIIVSN